MKLLSLLFATLIVPLPAFAELSYEFNYIEASKSCSVSNVASGSFKSLYTKKVIWSQTVPVSESCNTLIGETTFGYGKIAEVREDKSDKEYVVAGSKKIEASEVLQACVNKQKEIFENLVSDLRKEHKISDANWKNIEEKLNVEIYIAPTKKQEKPNSYVAYDRVAMFINQAGSDCVLLSKDQLKEKFLPYLQQKGLLGVTDKDIKNFFIVMSILAGGGTGSAPYVYRDNNYRGKVNLYSGSGGGDTPKSSGGVRAD
ncbi:MAG: hypothetical protein M9962_08140 [Oligoflexia bacterium]|nr:hypothetical protein [Oligoflexia bacterium]